MLSPFEIFKKTVKPLVLGSLIFSSYPVEKVSAEPSSLIEVCAIPKEQDDRTIGVKTKKDGFLKLKTKGLVFAPIGNVLLGVHPNWIVTYEYESNNNTGHHKIIKLRNLKDETEMIDIIVRDCSPTS